MTLHTSPLNPSGWHRRSVGGFLRGATALAAAIALAPVASARVCPIAGWLPGEGIPGVDGEVFAMSMWDPDGAGGPQTPKLVMGGVFNNAGNVSASKIAMLDLDTGQWSAFGTGMTGTGTVAVYALTVLNTGELVAGGEFTTAGGVACRRVAKWNGTAWSNLPSGSNNGVNGTVRAMLMHPDGNLIMGGAMNSGNPDFIAGVVQWNPVQGLRGVGFGLDVTVRALTLLPNGNIVAGGNMTFQGPVNLNGVAQWNGTEWLPMGSGMTGGGGSFGTVVAVTTAPNGDVIAAGNFNTAGGVPAANVARWNGSAWSAMGAGLDYYGTALGRLPNGNVLVARHQITEGGGAGMVARVYQWDGTALTEYFARVNDNINALLTTPANELVLAGRFYGAPNNLTYNPMLRVARQSAQFSYTNVARTANAAGMQLAVLPNGNVVSLGSFNAIGGEVGQQVGLWNGSGWSNIGANLSFASSIAVLSNGDLVATGNAQSPSFSGALRWNGASWVQLGPIGSDLNHLIPTPDGGFYGLGNFTSWFGIPCAQIIRWDGSAFFGLGSGFTGVGEDVYGGIIASNGDLIAFGRFTTVGGVAASRIARWNGSTWSPIGAGLPGTVETVVELPDGDLIAGGGFLLSRWDGTTWTPLTGGVNGFVDRLIRLPDGDLVATGQFISIGGVSASRIARWNGTTWFPFGAGLIDTTSGNNSPNGADLAYVPQTNELFVTGGFSKVGTQFSAFNGRYALGGIAAGIAQPPASGTVCLADPAALSIASTGTSPITYQWRKGTVPIDTIGNPSAATPSLVLSGVGFADAGSYDCVVTNDCGNATSLSATLSVLPDFNGDNAVNTPDLVFFLGVFGTSVPAFSSADISGDGSINTGDLVLFLASFGSTCP
ncbi:MAG: hypothetical protein ACKVZJ_06775 [Phycisphaerales bacterium]